MQKGSVGRPKKLNPIKSGQLKEGECRYTFITTNKNVIKIKAEAKRKNVSIKEYLNNILNYYWESSEKMNKNEKSLYNFLNKNLSNK